MERFNALKKVAAEEVRGGSTSSMSSAAANPTNAANGNCPNQFLLQCADGHL
jgi:hypothetical protein